MPRPLGEPVPSHKKAELSLSEDRCALEIAMSFGDSVLDVRHLLGGKSFVIGGGKAVDLVVLSDDLPASEFPLVRHEGGHFVLTFSGGQRGEIAQGGALYPLQWLKHSPEVRRDEAHSDCYRYALPKDATATLRFDGLSISLRHVTPPDSVLRRGQHRELRYGAMLLAVSCVLLVALGIALTTSVRPELLASDVFLAENPRVARLLGAPVANAPVQVGRVVLDTAPIVSGLPVETVALRIAADAPVLDRCVSALPVGSALAAELLVDATGVVTEALVTPLGRAQGEAGIDCVRDTLAKTQFPSREDGETARIVYTIGVR